MKQNLIIVLFIIGVSCSNQSSQNVQTQTKSSLVKSDTTYVWTKLLDSADWKKSYNFQMFTIIEKMWIFHPDGNWFSGLSLMVHGTLKNAALYKMAIILALHRVSITIPLFLLAGMQR